MKAEPDIAAETSPGADGDVESQCKVAPRFCIDEKTLYSRGALDRALAGLMDLQTFLSRVQPKKRFKRAYWGADLIDGMNSATALGENGPAEIVPAAEPIGKGRRAASPVRGCPIGLEPLDPKKIH